MKTLVFAPLVPLALWVALALCAAGLLAWYAIDAGARLPRPRRAIIVLLMGLGVALPLAILLNPMWLERLPPPAGKPLLTLLVDSSASMATADVKDDRTRFAAARQMAQRLAARMVGQYEVRVKTFAEQARTAELTDLNALVPGGETTDVARAIVEGIADDRPQGQALVLVSDGIHNAGSAEDVLAAVERAKAMAAPVFAATLGGDAAVRDLDVQLHAPQELAFVGQKVPVRVLLSQRGLSGATVRLTLAGDGQAIEQQAAMAKKGTTEVVFHLASDTSGLFRYEISAEPVAGEVTAANNLATLLVRVVDEPIRVLLLEGKPYWDTKFLLRTLASDPSIELVSVVRLAEGRLLQRVVQRTEAGDEDSQADGGESAGAAESVAPSPSPAGGAQTRQQQWAIRANLAEALGGAEGLGRFQIVVLGRDAEVYLNDALLENLRRWLARDGGSLVCFRGSPASQISQGLARLLPVRWSPGRESRFRVQLTDRGRQLRWLSESRPGADALTQLPTLAAVSQPEEPKPLAVVLAAGVGDGGQSGAPVITYQPFGSGRAVVVEGAGMWRWAFLPPEHQQHEATYHTLWHSLVRWLVSHAGLLPTQQRLLRTEKVRYTTDEPATATLLVRQSSTAEIPTVRLSGGSLAEPREVRPVTAGEELGAYRVVFGTLPEGRYQAEIAGAAAEDPAQRTAFDVRRDLREQLDLAARPDLMARIAEQSQGAVVSPDDVDEIVRKFQQHVARVRPVQVRRLPAWDRWWVLVGVCLVWGTTWGLRRAGGLV